MHFQINRLKSLKNLFKDLNPAAYAKDFRSTTLRLNMRGWMKDSNT